MCSCMGSMSVSSCRCCMFVSCVHPVQDLNSSSSSCHQTCVFHFSRHFFAISLKPLRSSNEQGRSRRVH